MAALATFDVVLRHYHTFEDGVPRVRDVDLAEWLEIDRPTNIRQVIEANREELEEFGALHFTNATPKTGGPIARVIWLNRDQALVICQLSRSRMAREVRRVLIKVFNYVYDAAPLAIAPRHQLRAVDVALDTIRPTIARMDILECRQERLEQQVDNLHRKPFKQSSLDVFCLIIGRFYNGYCPCCLETPIIVDHRLTGAQADHWYGKRKNGIEHGWYICSACNRLLENDPIFKESKCDHFKGFQQHIPPLRRQLTLF